MKLLAPLLAMSIAFGCTAAYAQTSETTTTTTTIQSTESIAPLVLPADVTYSIVDPTKSVIVGSYVIGQTLQPGYYIIEEKTGKVRAAVDSSGNLIALSTIPSALPDHFLVVDGSLVFFATDYAYRRAKLEMQVANDYAAGRLTHNQTKELRQKLSDISILEAKRKKDLTYSKSTMRSIERKFADVQGLMSRYIASTSTKKAKIGLRAD